MPANDGGRRSPAFLLIYASAYAGGVLAYLPLLVLFLPVKVEAMAGDSRLGLLTIVTLAGALVASLSNIVFGMASDRSFARTGSRRPWVWAGLAATLASFAGVAQASSPVAIVLAIAGFQFAVNILLAPLFAMMADEIPDAQKGIAGGLLAIAPPVASMVGGAVAGGGFTETARLAVIGTAMAAAVLPLLLTRRRPLAAETPTAPVATAPTLARIWLSRLFVQTAACILSTYLVFYFEGVAPGIVPLRVASMVGHVTGAVLLLSVPLAILLGRFSDRSGRRRPYLVATASCLAGGFVILALARTWPVAVAGYGLFACSSAAFLSLHAAYAMQSLPRPDRRGRDLGVLNLANTLPIFVGPILTWLIADAADFRPALMLAALLGALAAAMVATIPGDRRHA